MTSAVEIQCAAIIGATGPTGIHLARELVRRGTPVRALSRSAANLARAFAGIEIEQVEADAVDVEAVRRGIADCDVVFDCVGLPAEHMDLHPVTATAITKAASAVGSRCVQLSSFWSFLPANEMPLNEGSRRSGGNHYIQMRRRAEDIFVDSGGTVLQLPDFYGPEVHMSTLQTLLTEAIEGDTVNVVGSADTDRDYIFVPDAVRVAADLACHGDAAGRRWVVAGSGALSARRAAEIAGAHLGRSLNVRAAPPWVLRIMSLFSPDLRSFMPMVPHYAQPVSYDEISLAELIGPIDHTPYQEAIPETLDWLTERQGDQG